MVTGDGNLNEMAIKNLPAWKAQEKQLDVAEMKLLRWMYAITKVDKERYNEGSNNICLLYTSRCV